MFKQINFCTNEFSHKPIFKQNTFYANHLLHQPTLHTTPAFGLRQWPFGRRNAETCLTFNSVAHGGNFDPPPTLCERRCPNQDTPHNGTIGVPSLRISAVNHPMAKLNIFLLQISAIDRTARTCGVSMILIGQGVTLEHSYTYPLGTQSFLHSFGAQNATSDQTAANKPQQ